MVRSVFLKAFHKEGVLSELELGAVFGNWHELIDVSERLAAALRRAPIGKIGPVLRAHVPNLNAVLIFCENQQAAIDFIERKQKSKKIRSSRYITVQCTECFTTTFTKLLSIT